MTSTWSHQWSVPRAQAKQSDSDSNAIMLDDGASACITNCNEHFIESPKRVDRKVKGIKGHADATHHGTLKCYLEDDTGLVYILITQGAYLIPDVATRILSPQHLAHKPTTITPKKKVWGH